MWMFTEISWLKNRIFLITKDCFAVRWCGTAEGKERHSFSIIFLKVHTDLGTLAILAHHSTVNEQNTNRSPLPFVLCMQLWCACRQEIQNTEWRMCEYKHKFACIFACTSCAITEKTDQVINFTTYAMVSLLLAFLFARCISKVCLH